MILNETIGYCHNCEPTLSHVERPAGFTHRRQASSAVVDTARWLYNQHMIEWSLNKGTLYPLTLSSCSQWTSVPYSGHYRSTVSTVTWYNCQTLLSSRCVSQHESWLRGSWVELINSSSNRGWVIEACSSNLVAAESSSSSKKYPKPADKTQ